MEFKFIPYFVRYCVCQICMLRRYWGGAAGHKVFTPDFYIKWYPRPDVQFSVL